ncbi:MAG: hypothetical protein ACLQDM_02015 [Bradyrhizobium sp.]
MQTAASHGHFQQQTIQRKPTHSPVIAGVGAALVACALTLVLMTSSPAPVAAPDQAATSTAKCQMVPRKLLVSTTTGSGTVRLRAGGYLSPPIALSARPQAVVFPLPRPELTPVEEVIAVEGNANDVVISSDLTNFRKTLDVTGAAAFAVKWQPMKTC